MNTNTDIDRKKALGYDYGSTTSLLTSFEEGQFAEISRCRSSVIVGPGGQLSWPEFANKWQKLKGFVPSPKRSLNNSGNIRQATDARGVPLVEGQVPADDIISQFTVNCILAKSELDEQTSLHLTVTVPESYNNFNCNLMNKALVKAFAEYFPASFDPQTDLDLIPEPIAAALYYTYEHLEEIAKSRNPIGIITCDIGGGTTDTAYVRVEVEQNTDSQRNESYKLSFLVLAIDGNPNLGGDDITRILLNKIAAAHNIQPAACRSGWLWDACEKLKKELSDEERADDEDIIINLKDYGAPSGSPAYISRNRKDFEEAVTTWRSSDDLSFSNYISNCINNVISKGSQKYRDIAKNLAEKGIIKQSIPTNQIRLLPVGGCMRIPLLRRCLQQTIPKARLVTMEDDSDDFDSVARGAALYSAYRLGDLPIIQDISIENRTMYCISVRHTETRLETIVGRNEKTGQYDKKLYPNQLIDDRHFRLGSLQLYQSAHSVATIEHAQKLGDLNFGEIVDFEVTSDLAKETPIILSVYVDAIKHTVKAKVAIPGAHRVGSDQPFVFPEDGGWLPLV